MPEMIEFGSAGKQGNVIGIQPVMQPTDFASVGAFRSKLSSYLEAAGRQNWLGEKTLVVFPEYIGTWLVALNAPRWIFRLRTLQGAMAGLIVRRPFAFLRALKAARGRDRLKDALFRMNAAQMAAAYQMVFSDLAATYQVTIAAGSIVLPQPEVRSGTIQTGNGPLFNCTAVFRRDGSIESRLVYKMYPIEEEQPFTAAAVEAPPVFETAVGRIAVLICADSWYPKPYARIREQSADGVLVPSFLIPQGAWTRMWQGYNGAEAPDDVDPADPGRITEREAWLKYALAGRHAAAGIRFGVNVFLRGSFWDLGADGCPVAVCAGKVFEYQGREEDVMLNVHLT